MIRINSDIINDPIPKVQIGVLPPPLGGVSVYLYRLKKLRPQDLFIDVRNLAKVKKIQIAMCAKHEIVIHGCDWRMIYLMHISQPVRKTPYSIVLHGQGWLSDFKNSSGLYRKIIRSCLNHADSIQVVGNHIKQSLLQIMPRLDDKIFVRNAFLPPPLEDEPRILETYDEKVHKFIERHRPLIIANAFQLATWGDGIDLYGLDMCIELIHRLKKDYPQVGLLFALANDKYRPEYYHQMKERIANYGIQENIYFLTNQHELWPLFRCGQLMVRPTCTDGFGVSIQEALVLGCKAVASDVCQRPMGTVVFQNRDMNDFECKVRSALAENK